MNCVALNAVSGEFERAPRYIDKIMFGMHADIDQVSRDQFIQCVEERRGDLRGDGPVFALYDTIRAIEDTARSGDRRFTAEALIVTLRTRTHEMFEAELCARGGNGMPEDSMSDPEK